MKKLCVIGICAVNVLFSSLAAQVSCCGFQDLSYGIGYTYREDQLNWNFAGPNDTPNVLSELEWDDIRVNQVTFAIAATTCNRFYFRGYADYGRIFHGRNRDSDYAESGRQMEFSRTLSNAGRGEVFDLSGGVGYQWSLWCDRVSVSPLLGLSWQEQHLRMYDGKLVIPVEEKIDDLHSSYKTRWWGPWVGVDLIGQAFCKFSLFASFEYHWAPYQGKGHWNLREDLFNKFKHSANAKGWVTQGGVNYSICGNWSITLAASYQKWCAENGTHTVRIMNESFEAVKAKARLNDVNWSSFQAAIFLTYSM